MGKKQKMSKRQREAYERRRQIVTSKPFREWWTARRNIRPIPSDPFRAFMIDLGLFATPLRKQYWRHRTNRSDYPPIDLPRGAPRERRRLPSRKEERRRYRRIPKFAKPVKLTPKMKEIKKRGEAMLERFHLPAVSWRFVPEKGEGISSIVHQSLFGGRKAIVQVGTKGGFYPALGATRHELGHHGHYIYEGLPEQKIMGIEEAKPYFRASEIEREKIAWKIGELDLLKAKEPMVGVRIQKWTKAYYLGTYTGKTKSVMEQLLKVRS